MDTINPTNISDDQFMEGFSDAGEARMRVIDLCRPGPVIEFVDGETYTLKNADHGKILAFNEECTVSIPLALREAFMVGICQEGAGAVTVEGVMGITLDSDTGATATESQFVIVTLLQWGDTSTYRLIGRTA